MGEGKVPRDIYELAAVLKERGFILDKEVPLTRAEKTEGYEKWMCGLCETSARPRFICNGRREETDSEEAGPRLYAICTDLEACAKHVGDRKVDVKAEAQNILGDIALPVDWDGGFTPDEYAEALKHSCGWYCKGKFFDLDKPCEHCGRSPKSVACASAVRTVDDEGNQRDVSCEAVQIEDCPHYRPDPQ